MRQKWLMVSITFLFMALLCSGSGCTSERTPTGGGEGSEAEGGIATGEGAEPEGTEREGGSEGEGAEGEGAEGEGAEGEGAEGEGAEDEGAEDEGAEDEGAEGEGAEGEGAGCVAPTATDATCDGIDDDCDGQTDEEYVSGPCHTVCGEGKLHCRNGGQHCDPEPVAEVCNGLDDDCNGAVDDGLGGCCWPAGELRACYTGPPTTLGMGRCRAGTQVCQGAAGWDVCHDEVLPVAERCNGEDDDCNGLLDDLPGEGFECPDPGWGGRGDCAVGIYHCVNGFEECAGRREPILETCNGRDDDCDGTTDEGNPDGGAECGPAAVGECRGGHLVCEAGRLVCFGASDAELELCDNRDNDCDGVTDNEPLEAGGPCAVEGGVGRCASGTRSCHAGQWSCTPRPPAPSEACNGLDDDCDGRTDEEFASLGAPCRAGQGRCAREGFWVCTPDAEGVECSAVPSLPAQPGVDRCGDHEDDDCDGVIDEPPDDHLAGEPCATGLPGQCAAGSLGCLVEHGAWGCLPDQAPQPERCNGLDDDCDGQTDEEFQDELFAACTVGLGGCRQAGQRCCREDGAGTTCCGTPGEPQAELCLSLVDEDCDGEVDEGFEELGAECTVGLGGCSRGGRLICSPDRLALWCDAEAGAPGPELCDNRLDDDCDGRTDEGCVLLAFVPADLRFSYRAIGSPDAPVDVHVRNLSRFRVDALAFTIDGAAPGDYQLEPAASAPCPLDGTASLPGLGECQLRVRFQPTVPGLREARLLAQGGAADAPPATARLRGAGQGPAPAGVLLDGFPKRWSGWNRDPQWVARVWPRDLLVDSRGRVWVAGALETWRIGAGGNSDWVGQLWRFDHAGELDPGFPLTLAGGAGGVGDDEFALARAPDENIWVLGLGATPAQGWAMVLWCFTPDGDGCRTVPPQVLGPAGAERWVPRDLAIDRQGRLWVVGLSMLGPTLWSFEPDGMIRDGFPVQLPGLNVLQDQTAGLAIDPDGLVWITGHVLRGEGEHRHRDTALAVWLFDEDGHLQAGWPQYQDRLCDGWLAEDEGTALVSDLLGRVWVGGRAFRINEEYCGIALRYDPVLAFRPIPLHGQQANERVKALAVDAAGSLWAANDSAWPGNNGTFLLRQLFQDGTAGVKLDLQTIPGSGIKVTGLVADEDAHLWAVGTGWATAGESVDLLLYRFR